MPNKKNVDLVENLKTKVADAKSVVFAEYQGLSASQMDDLRSKLREAGAEASISKNTLIKIALEENDIKTDDLRADLKGPTITVFSYEDAIAGIKALFDFSKKNELPTVKAGLVDGQITNKDSLQILSNLPSKEQLLAQVVGGMKSPITGFVGVLGGVQRSFVQVISEISKQKEN